MRHLGTKNPKTLREGLAQFEVTLKAYEDAGANELEAKVKAAQSYVLGATKDEVIENVFKFASGKRLSALSRSRLDSAYDLAEQHDDWYGSPRTVWGVVSGLTELSQGSNYTDERTAIDEQASRLVEIAF